MLTDNQVQHLILALLDGKEFTTREEIERFVDWCQEVMTDAALVQLALEGKATCDCSSSNPDDWIWKRGDGLPIEELLGG